MRLTLITPFIAAAALVSAKRSKEHFTPKTFECHGSPCDVSAACHMGAGTPIMNSYLPAPCLEPSSCCSKINEARDKGVKDTYCQDSQGKRFDWQLKQDGYYWCPTREG